MSETEISVESLAGDILLLSRNSLLVNFRFLDRAVAMLPLTPAKDISLASDGRKICYGPKYILYEYRREQSCVTRNLLHTVLHCVFRHDFVGKTVDRARWDLAADMAVENIINDLDSGAVKAKRASEQQGTLELLKSEITPPLTAERIYKWLGEKEIPEEELLQRRECFRGDGHGLWYGSDDPDAKVNEDIDLKKLWEDISRRMQTEMETLHNDKNSALVQNLRALNRSRRSYTDFLRRFGVHGETMKLSEEEYDNNYYSYGLELYGNIPLVEPLEYSEQKKIREFVIAVDTSGSVRGDVVQRFIQHTYDILKRQESFFEKVDIYILQCDDRIRDAVRIRTPEDFDRYLTTLEIRGLGKTDFRPVFEFIEERKRQGELRNLQGLLYFTDGLGIFPARNPDYDTAFVLHCAEGAEPPLPPWAENLALTEEEILDGRFSAE